MLKWITPAILSFALCACTSVQVLNPNPHVESPENRGDRGLKIGMEEAGGHYYVATGSGAARPPNMSQPESTKMMDVDAKVLYAPVAPIEFGLVAQAPSSTGSLGLALLTKFQISGEGTRAAAIGDLPFGIYARVGVGYAQASGDQAVTFGPGGYPWKSTMDVVYAHLGSSVGIRFNEHAMAYLGAAVGQYWNSSEVDQNTASDNTPGGTYKNNDSGTAETIGPGVLFNWTYVQFYLTGEFTHIQYHLTPAENDFWVTAGISVTPGSAK